MAQQHLQAAVQTPNSSTANSANSATAAQTNESVDVTAVADKLKDGIEFKDEVTDPDRKDNRHISRQLYKG